MSTPKANHVREESVGKTSLLNQCLHRTFSLDTTPIIGAVMSLLKLNFGGALQLFCVWDNTDTPQFRSVVPMHCCNAFIAPVVFDLMRRDTFECASE